MAELLSRLFVKALVEPAHERVDADDGKDKPEDEADEQHVEDGGQSTDERVHDDLHAFHFSHGTQRPQRSKRSHRFEDRNVSGTEQARAKVDEGHGDDDKVEPTPRVAKVHNTAHGEKLEGRLEEEDHSENSVQVVQAVDEERSRVEPDVLQGHDKAAEQDESKHDRLEVLVLNHPEIGVEHQNRNLKLPHAD